MSAAMRKGKITRIHHGDHETFSILGVYAKSPPIVYGEYPAAPLRLNSAPARAVSSARAGVAARQELERRAVPRLRLVPVGEVAGRPGHHQLASTDLRLPPLHRTERRGAIAAGPRPGHAGLWP